MLDYRNLKSGLLFVFLFSFILKPPWLFDSTNLAIGDDLSYWLHAATLAFDFDLYYISDHSFTNSIFHPSTNVPFHAPGTGYLNAPFVFLFGLIDNFRNNNLSILNSQIGLFSYLGFFAGTLFYSFLSFYFLSKLLIVKNLSKSKNLILMLCFLSSLVHYSTTRFLMPHAHEFFLVTMLIYNLEKNRKLSSANIFSILSLYFLLAITRPSTFVISIVLLLIYYEKFKKKNTFSFKLLLYGVFLLTSYVYLARILYNSNTILLQLSQNATTANFVSSINFDQIFYGITKFPNLIFSFSGGLLWTTPIIIFGLIATFYNLSEENIYRKSYTFLYLSGFFLVAFVWQGQEVAYGQRLFIGVMPFFVLQTAFFCEKFNIKKLLSLFIFNSYLNYIFFYSSSNLTLKPGTTLWGTVVGFAPERYTLFLYKEIFNIENIYTIVAKSIYVVNLFGIFTFELLSLTLSKLKLDINKLSILETRANKYFEMSYSYIFFASLLFFSFLVGMYNVMSTKD